MIRRVFLWLSIIAWMLLIFWFSSAGHTQSTGQSMQIVHQIQNTTGIIIPEVAVRKTAHIALYAVLGILFYLLLSEYAVQRARRIWVSIALVGIYAASDELHQHFVGGRSGQVTDILLDTAAAFVAIILLDIFIKNLVAKKSI